MIRNSKKKKIVIIDYKMSNLYSVQNALKLFPLEVIISSDFHDLASADAAILPGVGAFKEAMNSLNRLDFISPIHDFIDSRKPFLGICLGFQLLFSESFEFGFYKGLGVFEGEVLSLKKNIITEKIPHIGWNKVYFENNSDSKSSFLRRLASEDFFYFVHSFFVKPQLESISLGKTFYDDFKFCSAVMHENVIATQFHPEKSGSVGLSFLNNFLEMNNLIGD
ncbi:MAG: imidazole glycerol phosphate synthase subunit HisH [Melioribacteraceae bacterium]|jgi:glutamine amidotransferase|nr:MAG: imidazole glycerol phosphate synthase subunit HisH [Melioribacteraceae bacterium]